MTREEAIYVLKNTAWLGSNDDRETTEQAVDMAIDALEQTAWIPAEERLPDDFEHVLVTLGNGYDGVTYDWRSNGDWYDWGKSVIAWMPLPEPYKGGDEE